VFSHRDQLMQWAEQGRIPPGRLHDAVRMAGVTPSATDWRRFLELATLWLGVVLLGAAVIFFFAYNWQALGRFAKFGIVEALLIGAVVAALRLGLDRPAGQAALTGAVLLTGALLALVGQVYQTGADPWELFAAWGGATLAWVLIGRFAALWLVWLGIANIAVVLYDRTFGGLFGILFDTGRLLWVLFALNTAALVIWEVVAARGVAWLDARWAVRLLATASGALATALALWAIFEHRAVDLSGLVAYAAWLAGAYAAYRQRRLDLYMLAGAVLSVVVVAAGALSRAFLDRGGEAGAFLLIDIVVIGISAAGAWWLKTVAAGERR
jgi:uncharacterized membrane protein